MGMFSWCCKGCGGELKSNEFVRLNGCVGEYDGYGGAGLFDYNSCCEEPIAWHEFCYQKATDKQKLDTTSSKSAENQGFGYNCLKFMRNYKENEPTKFFVEIKVNDWQNEHSEDHFICLNNNKYYLYDKQTCMDCEENEVGNKYEEYKENIKKIVFFDNLEQAKQVAQDLVKNLPNPQYGYSIIITGQQEEAIGCVYHYDLIPEHDKIPIKNEFYPSGIQKCKYVLNGKFTDKLTYSI